jgi:hypothetical protein
MDAVVSAVVALVVAAVTTGATFRLQENRLRLELRTQFMAEEAIRLLLQHERWQQRSFDVMKRHIGGFDDESLRQLLVRAGALRFEGKQGEELWGLRDRNLDRLT